MKHSKELQEIIDQFTGDYAKDLSLLADGVERYQEEGDTSLSTEILSYANTMMEERRAQLPLGEDDYATAYTQEEEPSLDEFYHHLEGAMAKINDGDLKGAEEVMLQIPKEVPSIKENVQRLDSGEELRSFQSLLEEVLYRISNPTDLSPVYGPETQIYLSFLGALYLDEKKYSEAVKYLTLSLKANPIDCNSLLALSKAERLLGHHDESRKANDRVFSVAYRASDLADAFANEGYFLYREEKENLAYSMYSMALQYQGDNQGARENYMLLTNKYPNAKAVSKKEFSDYMNQRNLPETVSEKTIHILEDLAKKAESEQNYDMAMGIWIHLDELLDDPNIHEHIHELMPLYQREEEAFLEDIGHHHHHHHHHEDDHHHPHH